MPIPKAPRRSAARSCASLIGTPISSAFPVGSRSRWLRRFILLESAVSIKRRGANARQQEGRDAMVAGVLCGCGTRQGSRATRYNRPRLRRSLRRSTWRTDTPRHLIHRRRRLDPGCIGERDYAAGSSLCGDQEDSAAHSQSDVEYTSSRRQTTVEVLDIKLATRRLAPRCSCSALAVHRRSLRYAGAECACVLHMRCPRSSIVFHRVCCQNCCHALCMWMHLTGAQTPAIGQRTDPYGDRVAV
jgi:hypothetical protein